MFALVAYNRIRLLENIKKILCNRNVGKLDEHKKKSKTNMSGGYIHKMNDAYEFGHPSSGGPLILQYIDREIVR